MKIFAGIFLSAVLLSTFALNLQSQVVINEIMPAPASGEPEWIELFNYSGNMQELDSCRICDAVSCKTLPKLIIPSGSYVVLCSDTSFLIEKYQHQPNTIYIQMSLPIMNNTTDEVILKHSSGKVLDSTFYNVKWGTTEKSLERMKPNKPAISQNNWGASTAVLGGTPGAVNSIFSGKCSFTVESFERTGDYIRFSAKSICEYKQTIGLVLSADMDKSGTFQKNEIVFENDYEAASNGIVEDSIDLYSFISAEQKGRFRLQLEIYFDEYDLQETAHLTIQTGITQGDIVINEIMPDPLMSSCEYIELFNNFNDTLTLSGWRIFDDGGSFDKRSLIIPNLLIQPQGYAVLSTDTTIFDQFPELKFSEYCRVVKISVSQNNSADILVLCDENAVVIDSLAYSTDWHEKDLSSAKGISLERITSNSETNNPKNWTSSADLKGGTPCSPNSASSGELGGKLDILPNPYHTKLSNMDCRINYALPFNSSRMRLIIFNEAGAIVAEPANNVYSHSSGTIYWNGKSDRGEFLTDGLYVVFIEAVSTENEAVFTKKAVLVLKN